jgi:hypothetical protein
MRLCEFARHSLLLQIIEYGYGFQTSVNAGNCICNLLYFGRNTILCLCVCVCVIVVSIPMVFVMFFSFHIAMVIRFVIIAVFLTFQTFTTFIFIVFHL